MLYKMNKIEENLDYINKNLEGKNIIVELTGTPKSGKTTCVQALKKTFEKEGIPFEIRRETAEYNPISKTSKDYNTWMVMELFKNTIEDIEGQGKIVIYDRGIWDRKFWLEHANKTGIMSIRDIKSLNSLYNLSVVEDYDPILIAFRTSPELSIKRKGRESTHINMKSLSSYNEVFDAGQAGLKNASKTYSYFETDEYQGQIREFIVDVTEELTNNIVKVLEERKKEKESEEVEY